MRLYKFILIAAAALALVPTRSRAQVSPATEIVLTTSTNAVAAGTTGTCTSQAFSADGITGFAVVPSIALSGTSTLATTGTGTVTFNFAASIDGVTFTSTTPVSVSSTAISGTAPQLDYINVAAAGVNNAPYWRLQSVVTSNTGAPLSIKSITISKSNR
jgi:hypothetical protein